MAPLTIFLPSLIYLLHTHTYFFLLQVIGYDANYTVRIDEDSIGRYICRASVKGFPEISATAELFMKGPPRILNTGKYIQRQH